MSHISPEFPAANPSFTVAQETERKILEAVNGPSLTGEPLPFDSLKTYGTVSLFQDGVKQATMSYSASKPVNETMNLTDALPLVILMNGGPSTPASAYNMNLADRSRVQHDIDGHLRGEPLRVDNDFAMAKVAEVVAVDPMGTGMGRIFNSDPEWFSGVEMDVAATAAFIEWYVKERHIDTEKRPIVFAGTSYAAIRLITGAALTLAEKGIMIAGVIGIAGYFEHALVSYDNFNLLDPYTTSLATISTVHDYHTNPEIQRLREDLIARGSGWNPGEMLAEKKISSHSWRAFNSASAIMPEYSRVLLKEREGRLTGREKDRWLGWLALQTGLSKERIESTRYRISPASYAKDLFEEQGKLLSTLDGRLKFDAGTYKIDVALEDWEKRYIEDVCRETHGHWTGYTGITTPGSATEWKYTGELWEGKHAYTAMKRLIAHNPKLRVLDFAGFYDLNCPAPRSWYFWDKISRETGLPIENHDQNTLDYRTIQSLAETSINTFIMPMGHQFNRDALSREVIGNLACSFLSMLGCNDKGRCWPKYVLNT